MPIRFIPDTKDETKPDGKSATVKIAISSTVTKSLNIFFNGNAEAAIALIQVHESIVADKKLKIQFKANRVLQSAKKAKMRELDKKTDKEAIDKLKDEINGLVFANVQLQEDVFDYFEKLLSPELTAKWRDIVKEECEQDNYVSLTGTRPGNIRGKVFDAIRPCYFRFLRLFCAQDSAERARRYITTNVVINLDKGLTVEQGVGRMIELNKTLPYLPCLNHKENSPEDWPAQNKEFSEVEMCSHVLFAMSFKVQTTYFAMVEDEFPTCLDALTQRLVRVEANLKEQKKAYGDIVNRVNNSTGGSGAKRTQGSAGESTPTKKHKSSQSLYGKSPTKKGSYAATEGKSGKNCDLCAKYSPRSAKTHNTSQCFKWNPDGSERARRVEAGRGNLKEKAKRYFKAIKKVEKLKKKMKKMKRKNKRSRKHRHTGHGSSSSSSSSSSSDSE